MSHGISQLGVLLTEAAPLTPGLGALVERKAGGFYLAFDDGTEMLVEQDASTGRRVATVALGQPPLVGRADVFSKMLAYNALWRETGGAWIALDGLDGELVLMMDIAGAEQPAALAGLLGNLVVVAGGWRAFLARQEPAKRPSAMATPSDVVLRG